MTKTQGMTCQICLQKYEMKYASKRWNVALPLTLIYIGFQTISMYTTIYIQMKPTITKCQLKC